MIEKLIKTTELHVNSIICTALIAGLAIVFIAVGEYCTAGVMGGTIGLVANTFAKR